MILITGANGQLGYDFQRLFREKNVEFLATDYKELDITLIDSVREFISRKITGVGKKLDLIINCAAYNNVDKAETEVDLCRALNTTAPKELAQIASELNCAYVTYSTDFVFDGKKSSPYTEEDETNPLGVYGKSKADGEKAVLQANKNALVVRTAWVFGVANNNFNTQVLGWAKTKNELSIVDDQISTPTYSKDLAEFSLLLLEKKAAGVFHVVNEGTASKFDQAHYVLQKTGWKGELKRAKTADFVLPAKRALFTKLSTAKIEKLLGTKIPSWQNAIDRYLDDSKS